MQAARRLVVLKISPWSERSKWALDHHRLAYEVILHDPFIGEWRLRRLVGPTKKRATVPVLLTGERTLTESWEIALYADREGKGARLIPEEREAEIRDWNTRADEMMAAGRGLVVASMLASPEALDEGLPPFVPGFLRPLLRPVTRYGMQWFGRKYDLRPEAAPSQRAQMRAALLHLREALAKSGGPYLTGTFSYADIVMATSLQGVSPVADRYIPIGPATRKAWTFEDIAAEFQDLIAWRDQLYERHRASPVSPQE